MTYNFDAAASTLSYTLEKKPVLAPESQIWNGVESTINGCRTSG